MNADLWIIRINREHTLASSAPCVSCLAAAKKYGIKRIFFSTAEGTIQKMNIDDVPEFVTRRQKLHGAHTHWNLSR